ncbi:MAG: IS30 family transposase [Deltaproteobacteria bacterium]
MEQPKSTKCRKKATHPTYRDRTDLETIIRTHWPHGKRIVWAQLGRHMGRSWRSVRAEYLRGRVINRTSELVEYNTYSAEKGQDEANALAANKGPRMRLTNILAERLRHWVVDNKVSPYVAIMRMRKEGYAWVPCVRTVYYAIERGDLEIIRSNLPYGTINMKPRRKGKRMAYRTLRGKSITDRPPAAELRIEYGHWEMDTVVGRTGGSSACLLVMTERTTREEIIRRLPDRSQRSVVMALRGLERRPDNLFASMRSLTCDNGSEFWDFAAIERSTLKPKKTRCTLYYTHPFSAFERGSNENNNRLIRRYIPKGSDIADFSLKAISVIEQKINTMERHSLGGLSAYQAKRTKLYEPAA